MTEFFQQLVNGLAWGSIYALIALGYTMIYGVLRLINFAHGDVYMIGAMSGFYAANAIKLPNPFAQFVCVLGVSMLACAVLGVVIERVAYRPLRNAPRLSILITAIGVSLLLQFGGQFLFGADPKFFPELITSRPLFQVGGVVLNNLQVLIIGLSVCLMVALRIIVMNTRMGRAMRAVSFSHTASQFVGINVNAVITTTFFIGSALAGAAGVLVGLSNPKVEPLMGIMPGIKAFVAAVLGGIGSVPGALLGGYVMGITETMVVAYWSSTYRDAIAFVILIVILLVKPNGILGKAIKEKV